MVPGFFFNLFFRGWVGDSGSCFFNLIFRGWGRGSCVSFKDLLSDSTEDQVNKLLQS